MKPPFVIMVAGLPGSGKSYFARRFAERLGAVYLSSDRIRKGLFESPSYTSEEKEKVYDEMKRRMLAALAKGEIIVLDGTFHQRKVRDKIKAAVAASGAGLAIIQVKAEETLVRERTSQKREESDADYAVYLKLKQQSEPIGGPHLELISTDENLEERMQKALQYLAEI